MIPHLISAFVIVTTLVLPVTAQDRRLPASPMELRMSYAPVVQKAAPSVVNVYAARVVENRNPFMDDPFFRRFFGGGGGGMPREQVQRALGSGVIVDAEGDGGDARVQVNFGRQGVKWLAVSVAKLQAA